MKPQAGMSEAPREATGRPQNVSSAAPGLPRAVAALVALLAVSTVAAADDLAPSLSPDRIEDAPSTRADPYPTFDAFAWRAFIALNWPAAADAGRRGEPDRAKTLADPGARVWETFKARYELFPVGPDGKPTAPTPWASWDGRNPCGANFDNRLKTVASFTPYAEFNQPGVAPGESTNPLVAQNRTYTRYEIRVNEPEYDAVASAGWSEGRNLPDEIHPANLPVGSIAIKAAWRLMTDADTPAVRARYYVVENAEVVDVAASLAAKRIVCAKVDVGLVGFHIMIKTRYRPQWLWSTFEQVDNVPPAGTEDAREPDAKDAGAPYSYYDPRRPNADLPKVGSPEMRPVSATNPPSADPEPMQVTRRHPVHASTMAMNRAYWALPGIKGTVWEHYMLVASQWPTAPNPPGPGNDGGFFPGLTVDRDTPSENYQSTDPATQGQENLVNTTLETYLQDGASSCMACHNVGNSRGRDFSGFLAAVKGAAISPPGSASPE